MSWVGLSLQHHRYRRLLVAPVFDARGVAGDEVLVLDRAKALPDATGAAEVGDARFGAQPGAGKCNRAPRRTQRARGASDETVDRAHLDGVDFRKRITLRYQWEEISGM